MNDYWDTSHDADLIAEHLKRIADHLEDLVELAAAMAANTTGTSSTSCGSSTA